MFASSSCGWFSSTAGSFSSSGVAVATRLSRFRHARPHPAGELETDQALHLPRDVVDRRLAPLLGHRLDRVRLPRLALARRSPSTAWSPWKTDGGISSRLAAHLKHRLILPTWALVYVRLQPSFTIRVRINLQGERAEVLGGRVAVGAAQDAEGRLEAVELPAVTIAAVVRARDRGSATPR
jgi:hypothetical protein